MAAAAAVALSWLPSLDLQSLRNRGSRRSGNGQQRQPPQWQWSWLLPSPDLLRQAVAPQQRQPPQWQWSWLLHSLDLLRQAVAPQQRQPPQQWEWSLRLHCSGSSR